MKLNRLIILLGITLMPFTSYCGDTLTLHYSAPLAKQLTVERYTDPIAGHTKVEYSEMVINNGAAKIPLDLKGRAYYWLRYGFDSKFLKLMPGTSYNYNLIVPESRVFNIERVDNEDDINVTLCNFRNDIYANAAKYYKKRTIIPKKKILRSFDAFAQRMKEKYNPFIPEMEYELKLNFFFNYYRYRKYDKALALGEDAIEDKDLDLYIPIVPYFLMKYIELDWRDRKVEVYPWEIKTKQDLYTVIFEQEMYPENPRLEKVAKLLKMRMIMEKDWYTNGQDMLNCLDSMMYQGGLDFALNNSTLASMVYRKYKIEKAPEFTLSDGNGNKHSLKDFRGKPVVLDFWATWCKPCVEAMPGLAKVHEKYKDRVQFISISSDDTIEKMNGYVNSKNYDWLFLYCGNRHQVKVDYNIFAIPRLIVINAEGNFVNDNVDYPKDLPEILDKLLN